MTAAGAEPTPIQRRIATRLESFGGVMGVAAIHLDTGETIAVNADTRFPTASAIKTAVMVEAFHQIAAGRLRKDQVLTLTDEIKVGGSGVLHSLHAGSQLSVADLLYLMIALSDNTATNLLLGVVGTRNVDDRMAAYGLPLTRLYRPTFRGGHADVFPEEEKEFGLGSSTPRETSRLMELIARGKAVSREASDEMIAILEKQQFRDMIPRSLPGAEAGVKVANKTGQDEEKLPDAAGVRGAIRVDSAIVTTPKGRYVLAIFARRVADTRWSVDNDAYVTGAEISRMVFDYFTR
ncbi:MAG TPA: serine hydrolase [Vicinamibacteria bacterium]|nr:serine hydrolase [Vicinamibacteria bacterium]